MELIIILTFLLGLAAIVSYGRFRASKRSQLPFPPGPPPEFLIGNFRHIPKTSPWVTYTEWKKKYGEVVSVGTLGKRIVILNSLRTATEIFEKRSNIYSDRPYNVMMQDLMDFNSNVAYLPFDEQHHLQRKLLAAAFNPSSVGDYASVQESETHALLDRLLDAPDDFFKHVRRSISSVILTIGYGHRVVSDDDHYVELAETTMEHLRRAVQPASFIVNLIPPLKYLPTWFPFIKFHRHAQNGRRLYKEMREKPFEMVKAQMAAGTAPHCYTTKLLDAKGTITGRDDEAANIQDTAAALYGGGSDATVSALMTFILAMVLHPDVQQRAQADIDSVVGNSRLPTLSDKAELPYINYIVLEALRWNPVSALGVPHALREDDEYEGYFIPKDSVVMSNIWAIVHDEELYSEPMKFWPERFDGRFPNIKDPRSIIFGIGRRSCPGRFLAGNSLFLAAACILSCFKLSKTRDANGKEEEPPIDYSRGPPANFCCKITPRSEEAIALIRATQAASQPCADPLY